MLFDVLLVIDDLTSTDNPADGLDVDTGGSVEIASSDLSSNGDDGADITVTVTLEATKSDAVVIDDGDGVTGPGDVIEYTVTIFPGGMAMVTFRVLVDDPLAPGVTEISNQGTVSGTGLADEPTDDLDTPDDDDPTLTPVMAPLPMAPIPTLAEWALGLLAALLAGLGLIVLRR